jgi:hypothetical protein
MHRINPSREYRDSLGQLAGVDRGQDALKGLVWAIANGPEDFPVVVDTLRLAKSEKLAMGKRRVILYLWFAIRHGNEVELLELELVPVPKEPLEM